MLKYDLNTVNVLACMTETMFGVTELLQVISMQISSQVTKSMSMQSQKCPVMFHESVLKLGQARQHASTMYNTKQQQLNADFTTDSFLELWLLLYK